MNPILIIGKDGQVGKALKRILPQAKCLGRQELDVSDLSQIEHVLNQFKPNILINAAAYTNVEQAQDEAQKAKLINSKAPSVMAKWCKKNNAVLVHYSSDYVFDGKQSEPWVENSHTNPINVYGQTKLDGEKAILDTDVKAFIFRTSWIYAKEGKNFVGTILKLAREKEQISVVHDQWGTPNSASFIAKMTWNVLEKAKHIEAGVYHLSAEGSTTWFAFANWFIDHFKSQGQEFALKEILPISSVQYKTKARRPVYSVLNTCKLKKALNILKFESWEDSFIKEFAI